MQFVHEAALKQQAEGPLDVTEKNIVFTLEFAMDGLSRYYQSRWYAMDEGLTGSVVLYMLPKYFHANLSSSCLPSRILFSLLTCHVRCFWCFNSQ